MLDVMDEARVRAGEAHAAWSERFSEMFAGVAGEFWRPTGFVDTYIMPLTPFSCQLRVHTRRASDTPVPSESSDDCSTLL